MITEKAS